MFEGLRGLDSHFDRLFEERDRQFLGVGDDDPHSEAGVELVVAPPAGDDVVHVIDPVLGDEVQVVEDDPVTSVRSFDHEIGLRVFRLVGFVVCYLVGFDFQACGLEFCPVVGAWVDFFVELTDPADRGRDVLGDEDYGGAII